MPFKQVPRILLLNHFRLIEYWKLLIKLSVKKRVNTVNIRKYVIFFLVVIFCILTSSRTIQAKTPSVTDCIQGEVDCADETEKVNASKLENVDDKEQIGTKTGESTFFSLIRMLVALLLVLALIYLLLKFLHKRNRLFNQIGRAHV